MNHGQTCNRGAEGGNGVIPQPAKIGRFQVFSAKSNRSGPGAEGAARRLYNVKINNIAAGESILEAPRRFAVAILREIKQVSLGRYRYEAICEHHCGPQVRSEEHTSELQSLMSISYAVLCLKKNT